MPISPVQDGGNNPPSRGGSPGVTTPGPRVAPPSIPSPVPTPIPRPGADPGFGPGVRIIPPAGIPQSPRPTPTPPAPAGFNAGPVDPSFLQWLTGIYQKFLGRAPEPAAILDAWNSFKFFQNNGGDSRLGGTGFGAGTGIGELAGGQDMSDIANKIATGPEAWKRNIWAGGLNPTQALNLLTQDYQSLLGRSPEVEAIESAVYALAGGYMSPAQLMSQIKSSPEYLRLHPAAPPPPTPTPTPTPTPAPPPPPPLPSSATFSPGVVRATPGRFDPNFAQNLGVFGAGGLKRPGAGDESTAPTPGGTRVAGGNITFDPFSQNPWGDISKPVGGGNAPVPGVPQSLLQSAISRSSALAPLGSTNPNNPPTTNTTVGPAPQSPIQSPFVLGAPTQGTPQTASQAAPASPPTLQAHTLPAVAPVPATPTPLPQPTQPQANVVQRNLVRNTFGGRVAPNLF